MSLSTDVVKKYDPDEATTEYRDLRKSTYAVKAGLAQMLKG
jgi:hypothetical protein